MATANTIFEYLTAKNPDIIYVKPNGKSKTTNSDWHCPKQIKSWEDFTFESLHDICGGALLGIARQKCDHLLTYPAPARDYNLTVVGEGESRRILDNWNRSIVNEALHAVEGQFNVSLWLDISKSITTSSVRMPKVDPQTGLPTPARPPRGCKKSFKRTASMRLVPDGHASLSPADLGGFEQRFPKEIKPSTQWKSEDVKPFLLPNGDLMPIAETKAPIWPIRQAFSYSVAYGCRYGCILSTAEAFIFRIRPRTEVEGKDICTQIILDGVMEHTTIPWQNNHRGSPNTMNDWTVNLALWFVHILAANNHTLQWEYQPLSQEVLSRHHSSMTTVNTPTEQSTQARKETQTTTPDATPTECSDQSPRRDSHTPTPLTPRKRKRGDDNSGDGDRPFYSFHESPEYNEGNPVRASRRRHKRRSRQSSSEGSSTEYGNR